MGKKPRKVRSRYIRKFVKFVELVAMKISRFRVEKIRSEGFGVMSDART